MLEMGPGDHHAALAAPIEQANTDLVFAAGREMKALWERLPAKRRGGYAENSAALEPVVLNAIMAGDAVMVKGSLGSRMGRIVKALQRRSVQPERALG
jgi:UDP-N-acetylmuramoyl-tripeptide--D-alanyl-D-alanine ligase